MFHCLLNVEVAGTGLRRTEFNQSNMKTKVLLFGILAEKAGSAEMELEGISTLYELKKHMIEKHPSFAAYKYLISVNQSLTDEDVSLAEGDEVALLPPFAGG